MPSFYQQALPAMVSPMADFPPYGDVRSTKTNGYYQEACHSVVARDGRLDYSQYYPLSSYAHSLPLPGYGLPTPYSISHTAQVPSTGGVGGFHNPNAPMLPPLRPRNDSVTADDARARAQQEKTAKSQVSEEQPIGGISAKLDYELERMTDFVAGAAQGIIQPGAQVQPAFRKWVLQVLTATRLPSATILLSLQYFAVRLREFPASVGSSEHLLYRFLAVSMIIGSKFLDDNTFINRSWSDVTGIKVSELNTLEIDWLSLIGFDLHADIDDPNGVTLWIQAWRDYDEQMDRKARRHMRSADFPLRAQQPPIAHSQHHTIQSTGYITPVSNASSPLYSTHRYMSADPWNNGNTPNNSCCEHDCFGSVGHRSSDSTQLAMDQRRPAASQNRPMLPAPRSFAQPSYTPWNHGNWQNVQGYNSYGAPSHEPYLGGPGYAPQPVIG